MVKGPRRATASLRSSARRAAHEDDPERAVLASRSSASSSATPRRQATWPMVKPCRSRSFRRRSGNAATIREANQRRGPYLRKFERKRPMVPRAMATIAPIRLAMV
jgi:hypothetical protein